MSLVHYEVAYHLTDNPNNTHVIRLLTGEDQATVDKYLRRKYGAGRVVLHYAEREPKPLGRERTCGYCGCTRTEYESESEPRPLHPATFDKTLWRQL